MHVTEFLLLICVIKIIIFHIETYTFRCPSAAEWDIKANITCPNRNEYYCVMCPTTDLYECLRIKGGGYVDGCGGPMQDRKGFKKIIAGSFTREPCVEHRYQPMIFNTNETSDCVYEKSNCMEEGQVIFNNGSGKGDRLCSCDYNNGYAFVNGLQTQFCSPSGYEDCSCYVKRCDKYQSLSSDFQCEVKMRAYASYDNINQQIRKDLNHTSLPFIDDTFMFLLDKTEKRQQRQTVITVLICITTIVCVLFAMDTASGKDKITNMVMIIQQSAVHNTREDVNAEMDKMEKSELSAVQNTSININAAMGQEELKSDLSMGQTTGTQINTDTEQDVLKSAQAVIHETCEKGEEELNSEQSAVHNTREDVNTEMDKMELESELSALQNTSVNIIAAMGQEDEKSELSASQTTCTKINTDTDKDELKSAQAVIHETCEKDEEEPKSATSTDGVSGLTNLNESIASDLQSVSANTRNIVKPKIDKSILQDRILELKKIYELVEKFIRMEEYDKPLQAELAVAFPNYMEVLSASKRDLTRSDCGIVITGETSAGKTTLINLLVQCKRLFVTSNLAATGKVCRIRNSDSIGLSLFKKDESLIKEVMVKDQKSLKKVIEKYTDITQCPEEFRDVYYVDVCLNVPMLEGNVIIVDTPGIGENEELDEMLLDFLPHAVSFIFIVNAQNAGGIHEDRLMKIFRKIIESRNKMPCFDPKDVIFLTNKWDGFEDDSSEEDESDDGEEDEQSVKINKMTDKEKTWNLIKDKLKRGWGLISPDRIFRLSLKQISKGMTTEFTEEYARFERVLKETIQANQNKRIKFYFSFLVNFTMNAKRGTLSRIKLLDRSEEEQLQMIRKNRDEIHVIKEKCQSKMDFLLKMKDKVICTLVEQLYKYINSETAKDQMLFRQEDEDIMSVSYLDLKHTIKRRIENGIGRWCEGDEYKNAIKEVRYKIESTLEAIHIEIDRLDTDMIGTRLSDEMSHFGKGAISLDSDLLLLTLSVFVPVYRYVLSAISLVKAIFEDTATRKMKINVLFSQCISQICKHYLNEMFEQSFGIEYTKIVVDIFRDKIPKQLDNLENVNEKLLNSLSEIQKKRDSLKNLQMAITSISRATIEFRKKHYTEQS